MTLTIFFVGFQESNYYQPSVVTLGGGGLATLGRGDLLAVLVVPDTRGRSTVATTHNGTDTVLLLSAYTVLGLGGSTCLMEFVAAKVLLSRLCQQGARLAQKAAMTPRQTQLSSI